MGCEVGGRLKREGTYLYLRLIHVVVWQKATQHCKATVPIKLKSQLLSQKHSRCIKQRFHPISGQSHCAHSRGFAGKACHAPLCQRQWQGLAGLIARRLSLSLSVTSVVSNSLWSMDYSLPGSSVHGISQARILEWVAIFFSRGSSWLRDWTRPESPALQADSLLLSHCRSPFLSLVMVV